MSNVDSPAVARLRVRLALRTAREAKRLTQTQIAKAMEWSLSKVMRIEKGDVNVSPNDLKVLLDFLDIEDPRQVRQLLDDARLSRQERWTVDPADREHLTPAMLESLQFEAEATTTRHYNNFIVPGSLQTRAYSEAIFRSVAHPLPAETIEARIAVRQGRQRDLLYRTNPSNYLVVLDESVMHRPIGGAEVMADQLDYLLRIIGETSVRLRILSYVAAAESSHFYGPFVLHDLEEQGALLYRENGDADEVVHAVDVVNRHRAAFDEMWTRSLSNEDSIYRVTRAISELRTGAG
jgi:transcriptional regulator with XRE-family HTH domain